MRRCNTFRLGCVIGLTIACGFASSCHAQADESEEVINIGSRRELFVDRLIVGELNGATLKMHTPHLASPVSPPRPHGHYATVLWNGEKYQFYYRGDTKPGNHWKKGWEQYHEGEVTLYAESKDAIHWTPFVEMKANLPGEHLYTACTQPYYRAPHIYIALPTKFMSKRGSATDILLMITRGHHYDREFTQSFIRPGIGSAGWANRANHTAIGIHQTSPPEMSLFLTGGRRYTLRINGFVSVNAPLAGGELTTKLLTFTGKELETNYSTSVAGQVLVELQDANGKPIRGFTLTDCKPIYGDHISRVVEWNGGSNISTLTGKTIQVQFEMSDADLYSLKFRGE